jgi:8-oxo-dGTP pyrophosphatase MutT (NUDIX family)
MIGKTEINEPLIRSSLKPLHTPSGLNTRGDPRHSDFDLSGQAQDGRALREAAVLVPLVMRDSGYQVLLTQRTDHLTNHAGQVSFPGGRLEADDSGHLGAALRETHEEIGLETHFLQPLGLLDDYETGTNFLVTPVVALVLPDFSLKLDEFEVADAFEVPLSFFFDAANHQIQSRMRNGERRHYYVFEYQERYIWGATAGMLMNFYRRTHGLSGPMRPPENV